MTELPRCPKCQYALVNGVCPIHEGRQVSDRLPMVAPMPLAREDARVLEFKKKGRRSA